MFSELAIALAKTAVTELMRAVGTTLAEALIQVIEETHSKVTYDGDEVHVETETDDIVAAAWKALLRLKDKILSYPQVDRFISMIPVAIRAFLRSFVIGVKEALIEAVTTQLFNDQWRQFNEGKAA